MTTSTTAEKPTRWELSNIYAGLEADDYRAAMRELDRDLAELEACFDEHQVRRLASPPAEAALLADVLEDVINRVNVLARLAETLESFVYGYFTTDSFDPVAGREKSKLEVLQARRQKLGVRLAGWLGSFQPHLDELIAGREVLGWHRFFLRHTARQSRFLMSEELEALAADLCLDGAVAFSKLQTKVTSQLEVEFERNGRVEKLPITEIRNLSYDPDPLVRRRAYDVEIEAWRSIATPVATSLNAIKGTARTIELRRGRASVLDVALDDNRIDRATLDALLDSIREAFPVFRRYLASKAKKLGRAKLPWWDLFAPVGSSAMRFSWSQARDFIVDKFATFNDELADMTACAFDRRWIDGEPRRGKAGGAYCMPVVGVEESRILANFDGSFEQVSTLAHELGHAFHNHCQRGLEPLRRGAPMTLAETASIFCEMLVAEAALAGAPADEQLAILESQLAGACQVCVDISSRFLFESAVIERRGSSELSADELCELMRDAQRQTYGDAVDESTYHSYMWLWKPHYYQHTENFYNFPYAFGHLFGLGLYAHYRREPGGFVPRYTELLRDTAQDYAAPLAARFGIDITRPDFWRGSLAIIEDQVRRYEALDA